MPVPALTVFHGNPLRNGLFMANVTVFGILLLANTMEVVVMLFSKTLTLELQFSGWMLAANFGCFLQREEEGERAREGE